MRIIIAAICVAAITVAVSAQFMNSPAVRVMDGRVVALDQLPQPDGSQLVGLRFVDAQGQPAAIVLGDRREVEGNLDGLAGVGPGDRVIVIADMSRGMDLVQLQTDRGRFVSPRYRHDQQFQMQRGGGDARGGSDSAFNVARQPYVHERSGFVGGPSRDDRSSSGRWEEEPIAGWNYPPVEEWNNQPQSSLRDIYRKSEQLDAPAAAGPYQQPDHRQVDPHSNVPAAEPMGDVYANPRDERQRFQH